MRRVVVVVVACGCGRVAFDSRADANDSGVVDAETTFESAQIVTELVDPAWNTTNPTLSGDQLEIFMVRRPIASQGGDIYRATRNSLADPFGTPVIVTALNSGADESGIHLSRDELVMYFASARAGGIGNHDIYTATRPARGMAFAAPVLLTAASTTMDESSPAPDGGQTTLIINRGMSPLRDLYESKRADMGSPWPAPQLVPELADPVDDAAAELTPDGLTVYFASERAPSAGGVDIWSATRPSISEPFGAPVRLDSLATSSNDSVPWISPDGRTLYFARDIDGQLTICRAVR